MTTKLTVCVASETQLRCICNLPLVR